MEAHQSHCRKKKTSAPRLPGVAGRKAKSASLRRRPTLNGRSVIGQNGSLSLLWGRTLHESNFKDGLLQTGTGNHSGLPASCVARTPPRANAGTRLSSAQARQTKRDAGTNTAVDKTSRLKGSSESIWHRGLKVSRFLRRA